MTGHRSRDVGVLAFPGGFVRVMGRLLQSSLDSQDSCL